MKLATIAVRNVGRHKGRTALTALGIAVAIILFILMRTFVVSWTGAIEHAAKDRLGTRHKVTFIMSLPKRYAEDIGNVPGVAKKNGVPQVSWMNWFGGKYERRPSDFFASMAVDAPTMLDVYDEIIVDPKQAAAWKANRQGALIGDRLATQFGWKVGDRVVLSGTIYPGNWEFVIEGIYTAERRTVDRSSFYFHWNYLTESLPARQKDKIGWIVTRIDDPTQSGTISKRIDAMFEERDEQTVTMSEKAMQQSFMGMITSILTAIDVVTVAILVIIVLILGNTIAMAVRERTSEYGCLRAIGFQPGHIATLVVGETLTIGLLGGLFGIGFSWLFINGVLGPFLEDNMGAIVPHFRAPPELAGYGIAIAVGLSVIASLIPAYRASRINVVNALRAIE
jgi:putative ABC transport system permease protein